MKQVNLQLDTHRPRFKHSYKIRSDRSQVAVSPPKLSHKLKQELEQRSLPRVVIKQLDESEFRTNSAVLKSENSYRDGQYWRLSSIHSDKPRPSRKVSKQQMLRHASLSNKKQIIVFKNEAIKSRLLDKIQKSSSYLQPSQLKINSGSAKTQPQHSRAHEVNRLEQLNDTCQIGLSSHRNPTVFFSSSFFKTREFNRILNKRVKMLLSFKKEH